LNYKNVEAIFLRTNRGAFNGAAPKDKIPDGECTMNEDIATRYPPMEVQKTDWSNVVIAMAGTPLRRQKRKSIATC